ncbi:MAG: hypothetical protein AB8B97_07025 [Granulosicoccus sp.]
MAEPLAICVNTDSGLRSNDGRSLHRPLVTAISIVSMYVTDSPPDWPGVNQKTQ